MNSKSPRPEKLCFWHSKYGKDIYRVPGKNCEVPIPKDWRRENGPIFKQGGEDELRKLKISQFDVLLDGILKLVNSIFVSCG